MYERFFGLTERPFDLTPNPRFLVLTPSHREALSNLQYAIASRKGVTLLTGDAGSGKTTLIRTAVECQQLDVHCVHLHNPALTREEFVETLAWKFGLSDRATASKAVLLVELEALLVKRRSRGETSVLIVDEAQSVSLELLEEVRLLANFESNEEKLLSLIIVGQPEVLARLEQQHIRQLKQRIALRCELKPLTLSETASYLAGRIKVAGGVAAQILTRDAVALIHEESHGIPRTINVLADNALLSGFAIGQQPVTSAIVREVCRDFRIGSAGLGARTNLQTEAPMHAPATHAPSSAGTPTRPGDKLLVVEEDVQIPARVDAAKLLPKTGEMIRLGDRGRRLSLFWSRLRRQGGAA